MLRRVILKPGQHGTNQLLEPYGGQLACERYQYDGQTRKRIKTAEILVAVSECLPPRERCAKDEWDSQRCVWNIRYDAAVKLGYATNVERREVSL